MNAQRRKNLQRAIGLLLEAQSIIDEAKWEEQEAFDNMPEGLQYSERGETMESNIDSMEEFIDNLSDIVEALEEM